MKKDNTQINCFRINIYVRNRNVLIKEVFSVPYFKLLDGYSWTSEIYFGFLPLVLICPETNRGTLLKHCLEVSCLKSVANTAWKSIFGFPSNGFIALSLKM